MRVKFRIGAVMAAMLIASGAGGAAVAQAAPVDDVAAAPALSMVPTPAQVETAAGAGFTLSPNTRIITEPVYQPIAELLAPKLRASTGYAIPVQVGTAAAGDIVLKTAQTGAPESYRVSARPEALTVEAATAHGMFNGAQTVRQLLPGGIESAQPVRETWTTPAVTINDTPRFAYRGVMVDVARSFQTVEEMKSIIDTLSAYKLNQLHWHLSDDQGWRIEITNEGRAANDTIDYTNLAKIGGATAIETTYLGAKGRTGFYTQAQYREVVAYAQERFVTIIPEIDVPGHTNSALHSIPELNTPGSSHAATAQRPTAPHNGSGDVGYSYLDPNSEVTFTFINHVLRQIAEMTPGGLVHVGGDEPNSMLSRYGDEVFDAFVARVLQILHSHAKSASGWNEISRAPTLKSGDHVQYWTGATESLLEATGNGAKVIMSRGASSYLDMKYNPKTPIGLTWACRPTCDVPQYYNWDPATVVPGIGDAQLAGVEAPLWGETVRTHKQAEFMIYPRVLAFSEMGWSPQAKRALPDFLERVGQQGPRLIAGGVNFYDGSLVPWTHDLVGATATAQAGVSAEFTLGSLWAPGTKAVSAQSVSVDAVDDADGIGASDLRDFTATIDWGDGSAPTPATLVPQSVRGSVAASGTYLVKATHTYTEGHPSGLERLVTITGSNGTTATASVKVLAPNLPQPRFTASATARCLAGKAYYTMTAVNQGTEDIDIAFETPYGEKTFTDVQPGKYAFHSFTTRLTNLPAGQATVTGSHATASLDMIVENPALNCGAVG